MDSDLFFQGWDRLVHIAVVGPIGYVALIAMLRVSGKRTMAKLNAFDFLVTVAMGSTLATILLNDSIALVEGVVALAVLIGLQYVIAWSSVRSATFARLVRSEPTLLMREGRMLAGAMRRARVTEAELMTVIRSSKTPRPEDVAAVILESTGDFSVIARTGENETAEFADKTRLG